MKNDDMFLLNLTIILSGEPLIKFYKISYALPILFFLIFVNNNDYLKKYVTTRTLLYMNFFHSS